MANMPDPTYSLPDDDPAVFVFADDDMLAPLLAPERLLMNIYEVDAGERTFIGEDWNERTVYWRATTKKTVYAATRGQARARFIDWWNWQSELDTDLKWTDKISIRLTKKAIDAEEHGIYSSCVIA